MNIGSVIPQIFYDLIARITPGLVISITGIFVLGGDSTTKQDVFSIFDRFAQKDFPTILVLFVALFASYIVAFVIDGLWRVFPFKFFSKLFEEGINSQAKDILSDYKVLDAKFDCEHFIFPGIALRYDAIRLRDPIAGARLAKLRAELHMCRVLILGLSVLGMLNVFNLFKAPFLTVIISESAIFIATVSFIATYRHLNGRFTWGTCNHWLLLVEPGIIMDSKNSELHRVSTEDDSERAGAA